MTNNMGVLIDKIERNIGYIPITPYLPDKYNKDAWAKIIKEDTIPVFSKYFPHKITYLVDGRTPKINGWYYLNKELIGNAKVLGIADICWSELAKQGTNFNGQYIPNRSTHMCFDGMVDQYIYSNIGSMFSYNDIFVETDGPEKFKLTTINNVEVNLNNFPIDILVQHSDGLNTIEPTKMLSFEKIAIGDVANFLYENLKYYESSTTFANVDLKLSDLMSKIDIRNQEVDKLEQNYISAANKNIPYIICC